MITPSTLNGPAIPACPISSIEADEELMRWFPMNRIAHGFCHHEQREVSCINQADGREDIHLIDELNKIHIQPKLS